MTAVVTLDKATVIAKVTEAYNAGRLSAQGPTPECRYRDSSGHPCAIGVCLSDDEVDRIATIRDSEGLTLGFSVPIGWLIRDKVIKTDATQFLRDLQVAHDCWAKGQAHGERDLRRLLGIDQ